MGVVVLFVVSTCLVVIVYRYVPVQVTPLMVVRACEKIRAGASPLWHHRWVALDEMSPYVAVAVIASEDQRFVEHHGFDMDAIRKAQEHNKQGGTLHGASTISQQTAKNVFLWQGRSWLRKGLEAYFTVLIEFFWGKERIMEVYLNSIEMGDAVYGVQAAAKHKFGKTAATLSRSDCALLAATLPNPRRYDAAHPSSYVLRRQTFILGQMRHIPFFPAKSNTAK